MDKLAITSGHLYYFRIAYYNRKECDRWVSKMHRVCCCKLEVPTHSDFNDPKNETNIITSRKGGESGYRNYEGHY